MGEMCYSCGYTGLEKGLIQVQYGVKVSFSYIRIGLRYFMLNKTLKYSKKVFKFKTKTTSAKLVLKISFQSLKQKKSFDRNQDFESWPLNILKKNFQTYKIYVSIYQSNYIYIYIK